MNKQLTKSIWEEKNNPKFDTLNESKETHICIVGAGISGLTIAYNLLKEGKKVIILDKAEKLGGETLLTSAHLSSALDDHYYHLEKMHGKTGAKLAKESHTYAINKIEEIVNTEKIKCEFTRLSGYLFATDEKEIKFLNDEKEAATRSGFSNLEIVSKIARFKNFNKTSLMFPEQAQFHPISYLIGLKKAIAKMGGEIYGSTFVIDYKKDKQFSIETSQGYKIVSDSLVFATNVPIHHDVMIHTKEAAYRTYVIGIKIKKTDFPKILLWDTKDPYHYVRKESKADHDILIVGGQDHRVGQIKEGINPFYELEKWTRDTLGIVGERTYEWSGQIIETVDGLAYIGKSPLVDNLYEVSGDSGHGLTHGTIAGKIISDLILHKDNEWVSLYDPTRRVRSFTDYIKENIDGAKTNIDWLKGGDIKTTQELNKNEGAIMVKEGNKVAVFKSEDGHVCEHSAVCPHLGALVRWNDIEKTWDCPFHGSRFSCDGEVINGPTRKPLKEIKVKRD